MYPVKLKSSGLRRFIFIVAGWVAANLVIIFGFDSFATSPVIRLASWQARSLFVKTPFNVETSGNQTRIPLNFRLMNPPSIKTGDRYPLLVFLHGAGQIGDDNEVQLLGLPEQLAETTWRARFPCFVLAPQCPAQSYWTNLNQELLELIHQTVKQYSIDQRRVYLTGLSMGGYGCWSLAATEPELFAAVVPICGGGNPSSARRLLETPIWAIHGDKDEAVPVEESQMIVQAIQEAGGRKIRYTELKGVGHNSWTQSYRNPHGVIEWMFVQKRN